MPLTPEEEELVQELANDEGAWVCQEILQAVINARPLTFDLLNNCANTLIRAANRVAPEGHESPE